METSLDGVVQQSASALGTPEPEAYNCLKQIAVGLHDLRSDFSSGNVELPEAISVFQRLIHRSHYFLLVPKIISQFVGGKEMIESVEVARVKLKEGFRAVFFQETENFLRYASPIVY